MDSDSTSPPPPGKSTTAHDHPHRPGCSCFSIIVYGLFLLVALVVVGLYGFERYIRNQSLKNLKPAEVQEFHQWAARDLEIPPEVLKVLPEPPASVSAERVVVYRDARTEFERIDEIIFHDKVSIYSLLQSGRPLTPEQFATLTSATANLPPLLARAKALFNHPDYVTNARSYPPTGHIPYLEFILLQRLTNGYALQQIYTGDYEGAVETLDTLLAMVRRDAAPGLMYTVTGYQAGNHAAHLASLAQRNTSDTEHLSAILHIMNRQRDTVYGSAEAYVYMGEYLPLHAQMQADGFTSQPTDTPRLLMYEGIFLEEDYLEWLDKQLPPGNPRKSQIQNRLREFRRVASTGKSGKFDIGETLKRSPLKFLLAYANKVNVDIFLVGYWKSMKRFQSSWTTSRRSYDLARLALAQRIAELEGQPVPATPADFVPKYLPEYPVDAATSQPIAVPPPGLQLGNTNVTHTLESQR